MKTGKKVLRRIRAYKPKGQLGQTTKIILAMFETSQPKTKMHSENVALMAEALAIKLKRDPKAAFFGGLLHDTGKLPLRGELFDGRNITKKEYAEIKQHVILAFKTYKGIHLFIAFCAGVHHELYKGGYGLKLKDFPGWMPLILVKKVLDTVIMITICDCIEAATHRNSNIIGAEPRQKNNLRAQLKKKFPDDQYIVEAALEVNRKLKL